MVRESKAQHDAEWAFIGVDPIISFMGSSRTINTWNDQDVRHALTPLLELARTEDAAMLVVRHFNKSDGANLTRRGGGSIGFQGLVRCSAALLYDPQDPTEDPNLKRRLLIAVGSNVGMLAQSQAFKIEPAVVQESGQDLKTSRLVWLGPSDVTAMNYGDQLHKAQQDDAWKKIDVVKLWLRTYLARGACPAAEVKIVYRTLNIGSTDTLERAARPNEGVVVKKRRGHPRTGQEWYWGLSEQQINAAIEAAERAEHHASVSQNEARAEASPKISDILISKQEQGPSADMTEEFEIRKDPDETVPDQTKQFEIRKPVPYEGNGWEPYLVQARQE